MDIQIFYWTGKIIWWSICISVIAGAILAPIAVYRKSKKHLWMWKVSAEIASSGFSPEDIRSIALYAPKPPCDTEELFKWLEEYIKAAKVFRERKNLLTKEIDH